MEWLKAVQRLLEAKICKKSVPSLLWLRWSNRRALATRWRGSGTLLAHDFLNSIYCDSHQSGLFLSFSLARTMCQTLDPWMSGRASRHETWGWKMCKTDETGCRQIRAFENFEFRDLHLLLVTFVCLRRRWWRLRNGVWHRQNRRSPWFDDSWMLENVWSLQCGRLGLG